MVEWCGDIEGGSSSFVTRPEKQAWCGCKASLQIFYLMVHMMQLAAR